MLKNSLFLSPLSEDMTDLDFIAVKIGDVTGSTCSTCVKRQVFGRYASGRSSVKNLSVGVYPNPASNFLQVVLDAHDFHRLLLDSIEKTMLKILHQVHVKLFE